MPAEVLLTAGAEHDLEIIYHHIAATDGEDSADYVLQKVLDACDRLTTHPERGTYSDELLALGIMEYRQLFFKPYRLIYRMVGQNVYITLIADGRRDMQALLARRLLGSG